MLRDILPHFWNSQTLFFQMRMREGRYYTTTGPSPYFPQTGSFSLVGKIILQVLYQSFQITLKLFQVFKGKFGQYYVGQYFMVYQIEHIVLLSQYKLYLSSFLLSLMQFQFTFASFNCLRYISCQFLIFDVGIDKDILR